jgi:hypothetical protein
MGLRLAIGIRGLSQVTLVPAHSGDQGRARRLADRANGVSPLHQRVVAADEPLSGAVFLAGLASAATAGLHAAGPVVAVRSGDDGRRVNLDQRFDRVRAAAGQTGLPKVDAAASAAET